MKENFIANSIEQWSVDHLVPYAQNPRQHPPEQIDRIAASMQEFGFTNPILVDSRSGIVADMHDWRQHAASACVRSR